MEKASFNFPLRVEQGQRWCALSYSGIKRIDVVAYNIEIKAQHSFAGGHRHRLAVCRDDVHILFPKDDIRVDITAVAAATEPPKRRHRKR
jgi:hypothetical protein